MSDKTPASSALTITSLLVDTEPYLSCDDCFERIDQYVEGRMADPHHDDLEMTVHLAGCGVCAEEADALEALLREDAE